jgi:hypothetical protein
MKQLIEKLVAVQRDLKAPKNQYNSFGKYKYRSCEDIVEAVKPLLAAHGLFMMISDKIVYNSETRVYIEATVSVTDGEHTVEATGYAREAAVKKGMDDSQITGATSSYARKYALNGMFGIDDTKDADATNKGDNNAPVKSKQNASELAEVMADGNDIATVQYWRSLDQEQQQSQWQTIDRDAQKKLKAIMAKNPA